MDALSREDSDLGRTRDRPPAGETLTLVPEDEPEDRGSPDSPEGGFAFRRGVQVGRYVVLRAIGSGGMGNVYAAYDPELDRKVALKVLRADLMISARREEAQQRLLREAQAVARLTHPNVVTVYDTGTVGERLFIAMELIEGRTLGEWLNAAPRSWREALEVFVQAGRGLAAAHRVGLVHRDFKPGNVMLGEDGRARVVDFGLAKAVGQVQRRIPEEISATSDPLVPEALWPLTLTLAGKALGTPAYMAPEQVSSTAADARADQFSFCLALYEALYGELPFAGADRGELAANIAAGTVRDAPADSKVPGWLRRVVVRGLSLDPAARFPSMDELLAALARNPAIRRRRWMAVAVAALGSFAAAAGVWDQQQRREQLCQGAERKLAGIWDPARKALVEQAFLATGVSHAAGTWRRVERSLDDYAAGWVTMHTEACEATHRRGEQSEAMLDRQVACLDARAQDLSAVSGLFARADLQTVDHAARSVEGLPPLAACADRQALLATLPPPDEAVADQVREMRGRLAEAKALLGIGKFPEALEIAQSVDRKAAQLDYRPLIAEARFHLGLAQGRVRQLANMQASLFAAAKEAMASGHDAILARAFCVLIISSQLRGEVEEARRMAELAGSAIERLGGHPGLESARRSYLGELAVTEGRYEEALEHFTVAAKGYDLTPVNLGSLQTSLGSVYLKLGRREEAVEISRKALANLESGLGAGHRHIMAPLLNLAEILVLEGDYEPALALFERALQVIEKAGNPGDLDAAYGLTGMGRCLNELGRSQEAVSLLQRAVRIRVSAPVDPALLADSRFELARALDATRQKQPARDLASQARQALIEIGERGAPRLERVESWLRQRGWTS